MTLVENKSRAAAVLLGLLAGGLGFWIAFADRTMIGSGSAITGTDGGLIQVLSFAAPVACLLGGLLAWPVALLGAVLMLAGGLAMALLCGPDVASVMADGLGIAGGAAALLALRKERADIVVVGIVIAGLWQLGSLKWGEFWLGSPAGVVERTAIWLASGDLVRHSAYTLEEAFLGFVLGAVPGAVLPFLLRRHPILNAILDPYIVAGYALPKLALVPLLIIWFGIGIWSKVVLVIGLTFFIVMLNTQSGIRGVSPQLIRMGEILGADETKVARSIVWPSALPHIMAGVRVAVPFSIGAAAIAEILSANRGLGFLITASSNRYDATGAFTAIIALTILVAIINLLIDRIEHALLGWRPADFGEKQESASS